ncbi:MAG: hypothetical protein V3U45_08020 [bacterium]
MAQNPRTDPVALAVSLLDANWDVLNTSNVKPGIADGASGGKLSRADANGGAVTVYGQAPYRRERTDTEGRFKTHFVPVIIQMECQTRTKLLELSGEVERIYNAQRNDPDAYWDWIEDMGETPTKDYPRAHEAKTVWEFRSSSRSAAT